MKTWILALYAAVSVYTMPTIAADYSFGPPRTVAITVMFGDSSSTFRPSSDVAQLLSDAKDAAIIYVSGRTSTNRPSKRDEDLALARAAAARAYLVARGVSPLKIMVNYASAADYAADNSTAEGRARNQRVDIEIVYIPIQ